MARANFKYRKKYQTKNIEQTETLKITKFVKREMLLTAISVFGVLLVSVGSAFSVFTSFSRSTDYNKVVVGNLLISYSANNDTAGAYGDTLNLSSAYPISDSSGKTSKPYRFTLTNDGTLTTAYTVAIKDDQDMIAKESCSGKQISKDLIKVSINGGNAVLLSSLYNSASDSYVIESGIMARQASKTYDIRMWIKSDAGNAILGKHFHAKLVVDATETTPIVEATLTSTSGQNETITERGKLEGKVIATPSTSTESSIKYNISLSSDYKSAVLKLSVPNLLKSDAVTTTFTDGTATETLQNTVLADNLLQVTITKSGTLTIQKGS